MSAAWPRDAAVRACALLAAIGLVAACDGAPPPTRIVLITLDTLRQDVFASEDPDWMPRTRAFAERGLVFEQCYAAGNHTQPTHASLLTGRHPWEHGLTRNGQVLPEAELTLAQTLSDAGWWTGAVVASFPLAARFGFARGFDEWVEELSHDMGLAKWQGAPVEGRQFYGLARPVTDQALRLLEAAPDTDQLLWVHYFDAHDPYGDTSGRALSLGRLWQMARLRTPGLEAEIERARRLYLTDVAALDGEVARLLAALDAEADGFRTYVMLTADHGESLGEHGSLGHGFRLTDEEIRVPCALVGPGIPAALRGDPVGSVDFHATALALAGLAPAEGGRNLGVPPTSRPLAVGMRGSLAKPRDEARTDGRRVAVRDPWFYAAGESGLYTGDGKDVWLGDDAERPAPEDEAAAYRTLFGGFARELEGADTQELIDAETREALRTLGYVE